MPIYKIAIDIKGDGKTGIVWYEKDDNGNELEFSTEQEAKKYMQENQISGYLTTETN